MCSKDRLAAVLGLALQCWQGAGGALLLPEAGLVGWGPLSQLDLNSLMHSHLNLQTKPVDPTVDGGAQVQQVVNIECVSDFTEAPVLNIQFR
jgi:hypothetical protein